MAIFATSLLVLWALVWGPAASQALPSVQEAHSNGSAAEASLAFTHDEALLSVQEAQSTNDSTVLPECRRRIPAGYEFYEGLGHYKMHYGLRTWHQADLLCVAEGGYLVVLNSHNEANLIRSMMARHGLTSRVHVGFSDVSKKGKYVTVLGDTLSATGYSVWAPGQPDKVGTELCGGLNVERGFHDIPCTEASPSVCELHA